MAIAGEEGSNRDTMRRQNLGIVLTHMHRAGQLSRSALTTATGLSRSTIGLLIADLEGRGLLSEGEAVGTGSPGRPSSLVHTRGDAVAVLAADLQVSHITFAVTGLGGEVHERVSLDRPTGQRGVDATLDQLHELIEAAMAKAGETTIVGIGISVAGIVRGDDGFVHLAPNLGWRDVRLGELIRGRMKTTGIGVYVGNEADLGALAEHARGAGSGTQDMIYVSGEIGVGGGVIVGGRALSGAAGYGGEIGHMVVNSQGHPCRCGSVGCWETEAGQSALLRHMGWSDGGDRQAVEAILREAAAGSERAQAALAEVGGWLGVGIANLINIFNPQRVVLGGLYSRAFPHLIDAARREVDSRALRPSRALAAITPAMLGEDSSLVGAGELALAPLLADPTSIGPVGHPRRASQPA